MSARRLPALALGAALALSGALRESAADDGDEEEAAAGSEDTGGPEVLHMPLLERQAEQGILRAVPIELDLPREVALRAKRVLVHYRLWGDPDWTTIELRRKGGHAEGAIPCLEISTVTGDLKYYIRVHDAEGRVIATGASRAAPYRVAIKHDDALEGGGRRAAKCPDPADCPRGLPGCPSERVIQIACRSDGDCEGGTTCSFRGFCERVTRRYTWVSLSVQQDVGVIAATGACSVASQESEGYACYQADGDQYIGTPALTNEPVAAGRGPTRVVIGVDHVIHYNTSLGLRAGLAFLGEGPTPRAGTAFVPFSIAVRATHWFGEDPFGRPGLRPFALLTAGYAMVDIEAETHVREDPTVASFQGGNDLEQTVGLRKRAGDGFVGVGAGASIPLGARVALAGEVALLQAFPFSALVIAPSAGLMVGF